VLQVVVEHSVRPIATEMEMSERPKLVPRTVTLCPPVPGRFWLEDTVATGPSKVNDRVRVATPVPTVMAKRRFEPPTPLATRHFADVAEAH